MKTPDHIPVLSSTGGGKLDLHFIIPGEEKNTKHQWLLWFKCFMSYVICFLSCLNTLCNTHSVTTYKRNQAKVLEGHMYKYVLWSKKWQFCFVLKQNTKWWTDSGHAIAVGQCWSPDNDLQWQVQKDALTVNHMTRISIVGHPSCSLPDNDLYGELVSIKTP